MDSLRSSIGIARFGGDDVRPARLEHAPHFIVTVTVK